MLEQFEKVGKDALADLKKIRDFAALEDFRIKYLGRKGQITQILGQIGQFSPEQKPLAGQLANRIKKDITKAFEQLKDTLLQSQRQTNELIDITLPGIVPTIGRTHIITQTLSELLEIFGRMGFAVAYGPEVEDEWHNFAALNIGPEHPARDPFDAFYIDDNILLRILSRKASRVVPWFPKASRNLSREPSYCFWIASSITLSRLPAGISIPSRNACR